MQPPVACAFFYNFLMLLEIVEDSIQDEKRLSVLFIFSESHFKPSALSDLSERGNINSNCMAVSSSAMGAGEIIYLDVTPVLQACAWPSCTHMTKVTQRM